VSGLAVSALIITHNEEKNIERCLQSLDWTDELVVIDANSTDRTREICQLPGRSWSGKTRVVQRAWTGFRDQRNFALEQAQNSWVLVVDADEVCTPELAAKIRELLNQSQGPDRQIYKVHRREFFQGKPIFYGMWNPSYQDRFFNKLGVQYINEIHEYPFSKHPPGKIHESLLHLCDLTVERYLEKLNRYTTIEARDRFEQGQRTTVFKLLGAFPAHTFKSFFYYQAYRDGMHGFIISLLEGISRVVRQIKIWQLMVRSQESPGQK